MLVRNNYTSYLPYSTACPSTVYLLGRFNTAGSTRSELHTLPRTTLIRNIREFRTSILTTKCPYIYGHSATRIHTAYQACAHFFTRVQPASKVRTTAQARSSPKRSSTVCWISSLTCRRTPHASSSTILSSDDDAESLDSHIEEAVRTKFDKVVGELVFVVQRHVNEATQHIVEDRLVEPRSFFFFFSFSNSNSQGRSSTSYARPRTTHPLAREGILVYPILVCF